MFESNDCGNRDISGRNLFGLSDLAVALNFLTTKELTTLFCVPSDYKYLSQIDDKTQSKVETLLTKKVHGLGGWKQVAIKYDMDQFDRDSLEESPDAGKTTIGYVKAAKPYLTVYEFCKTLKEHNIRRFDIIKELLGHLSVVPSEKTT